MILMIILKNCFTIITKRREEGFKGERKDLKERGRI
jgi:hypothetical protein